MLMLQSMHITEVTLHILESDGSRTGEEMSTSQGSRLECTHHTWHSTEVFLAER